MRSCSAHAKKTVLVLAAVLAGTAACGPTGIAIFGNWTTLGGTVPGQRGTVQAIFINNTPFRAVFTYGLYDPQNSVFAASFFGQFMVNPDSTNPRQGRLEGMSQSSEITLTCGRVFSLGGQELIDRIEEAELDGDADALTPGIAFSDRPVDDPDAGKATAGRAASVTKLQGVEFPCDSMVSFTFEPDETQPSGVRVDFEVVSP